MKFKAFQLAGKPGGGVASHIIGGVTRSEHLPTGEVTPLGDSSNADATKDKRFTAAKAPSKSLFTGNLAIFGKP